MRSSVFALAALAAPAFADLSLTHPTSNDKVKAGEEYTVEWIETGDNKTLPEIGESTVFLYAGKDSESMIPLTQLGEVNAPDMKFNTTIDPELGQDGKYYSLRIVSNGLKSDKEEEKKYDLPYIAYSDIFEITDMTGTFNETLQDATDAKPTSTSSESTEPTGDANSNSDSDDDDSSAARNTAFAAMGATILGASIYLL
ncbi:hypothetical protein E3Q22_00205 [Wallemia mellicola]|uniref:Yeast cell wall synthesis Kre9/Knh1-like N-terminal domain-containing protein n=2 Tax=Wallemia mellicola TaxID=1708541 RepID=A0A4T0MGM0_9BASI|nr:hypothetical protein WALSEDRAFT_59545 [Wallemia mellicola CBS 633.66]TIB75295.1 hypothetical protein E3Q24_00140 [Wallemia mellicola]EIM23296.1 hypothetical protein WALSEDRAFT_59545 [Wallemia mellicola CBS 633.66]TIB78234.1 hypothetical protein E3Q23_00912 [Wallemia mellicola]TIB82393.1 hypothetical protein E3Q22_00205 [Wallemia mellicola]TIB89190.1 hypothetical protein E3Q21_00664 [Wallemia mellicola]|eukprot:XP_006956683.1 hypothetical protein WALSEDRAFT_59545 [Wallemia mellicola CBS 633.66]